MDDIHVEIAACLAAKELFTNGSNEVAERLVLELPGKKDGGGWCRQSVEDVVCGAIKRALRSKDVLDVLGRARKRVEPLVAAEAINAGDVGIGNCPTCKRDYVFCICPSPGRVISKSHQCGDDTCTCACHRIAGNSAVR